MLEKEKKFRGKRVLVLVMAMVLCVGASVSVFAGVRFGSVLGLDYIFIGKYENRALEGATGCEGLAENKVSYVSVEFEYNSDTKYQSITYGIHGTQAYLYKIIGTKSANWRIYNCMKNKKRNSTTSVYSGAYTFY